MEHTRMNYLLNLASVCENDAVRSFLLFKSVRASAKEGYKLPEKFKNATTRCPKCLLERTGDNYECRLRAEARNRFARKLSRKVERAGRLTKYQARYLRRRRRKHQDGANTLVIQCTKCKKTAEKHLQKPPKAAKVKVSKMERRKKGSKKSDAFAGLNREAVEGSTTLSLKQKLAVKRARRDEAAKALRLSEKVKTAKKNQLVRSLSKMGSTSVPRKGLRDFLDSL